MCAGVCTGIQQFRGHNLCWGNDNPSWLLDGGYNTSAVKMQVMGDACLCVVPMGGVVSVVW